MYRSGEMTYISAMGKGVLILNSHRVAVDLLEKRSNIYSNRPHYICAGDLLTQNLTFAFSPYDNLYPSYALPYTVSSYSGSCLGRAASVVSPENISPNRL